MKGHDGALVSEGCAKRSISGKCEQWDFTEYRFDDPNFRAEARQFGFVCNLSGQRYHICPDIPGLCKWVTDCTVLQKIFGGCNKDLTIYPVVPYQALIDGGLFCFSEAAYDFPDGN